MDGGTWWAVVHGVTKSWTWLSDFSFTFHFHALEKEMATHSSVLAWRIPGTGEPHALPSLGSHRVGHDWSDLAAVAAADLTTNKIFIGRDKLYFRQKKSAWTGSRTLENSHSPGEHMHCRGPTPRPGRASNVLCSETQATLQKAWFRKGVPNGVCYDSPTLALKRDRDRNPKDHFNPSFGSEEQNRYQRWFKFEVWSFPATLYSTLPAQDEGGGRQLKLLKGGMGWSWRQAIRTTMWHERQRVTLAKTGQCEPVCWSQTFTAVFFLMTLQKAIRVWLRKKERTKHFNTWKA